MPTDKAMDPVWELVLVSCKCGRRFNPSLEVHNCRACRIVKRVAAALDAAREEGVQAERERCASFANDAARNIREGVAIRSAEPEGEAEDTSPCPQCGEPAPTSEFGVVEHLSGCGYCKHPSSDGDESGEFRCNICGATDECAKPEPLYTFTADGSKGQPTPPWFEEACKRGDVFARKGERDIASIPLVNMRAKPEPCATCGGKTYRLDDSGVWAGMCPDCPPCDQCKAPMQEHVVGHGHPNGCSVNS